MWQKCWQVKCDLMIELEISASLRCSGIFAIQNENYSEINDLQVSSQKLHKQGNNHVLPQKQGYRCLIVHKEVGFPLVGIQKDGQNISI
jgi:hypothetical protein